VNPQALGENPLARRRDSVFRKTDDAPQPDPVREDTPAPVYAKGTFTRPQDT